MFVQDTRAEYYVIWTGVWRLQLCVVLKNIVTHNSELAQLFAVLWTAHSLIVSLTLDTSSELYFIFEISLIGTVACKR